MNFRALWGVKMRIDRPKHVCGLEFFGIDASSLTSRTDWMLTDHPIRNGFRMGIRLLTLSPVLSHQCRTRCRLLTTPHNRPLVWCQPNPALVSDAVAITIPIFIEVDMIRDPERPPLSHILPHPFPYHRLCDCVDNSCRLPWCFDQSLFRKRSRR